MYATWRASGPALVGRGLESPTTHGTIKHLRLPFVECSQALREKESKIARSFETLQEKALFGKLVFSAFNEQKGSLFRPPREQPSFSKCSHTFG